MVTATSYIKNAADVQCFGLLLILCFSLIELSSALASLRLANRALGKRVFEWVTVGQFDKPVLSSGGRAMGKVIAYTKEPHAANTPFNGGSESPCIR